MTASGLAADRMTDWLARQDETRRAHDEAKRARDAVVDALGANETAKAKFLVGAMTEAGKSCVEASRRETEAMWLALTGEKRAPAA